MDGLDNFIAENFIVFTFSGISTQMHPNGQEKKIPLGMPKHADITKENFKNFINKNHKGCAIRTGEISNITVLDFDDIEVYNQLADFYPELKKHRTIKTKNGFHIYCQYNKDLKNTTNVLKSFDKVDIRNDGGILFCPPTTYKLQNGTIIKYEDLGGEILPIPEILMADMKPTSFVGEIKQEVKEVKEVKPQIIQDESKDLDYIEQAIKDGYLNFKSETNSYDDWRDVGFIVKQTSDSKRGLEIFQKFSKLNASKYDEEYTNSFWKTIKQPKDKKPLTIATLKKWINEQKNPTKEMLVANTDIEACNKLYEELKDVFKSYKGRLFYLYQNIWIYDELKINDILINYIMNRNICLIDEKGKKHAFGHNLSKADKIAKTLCMKIRIENEDDTLYNKFHITTKTKICFNDGILDFKNKKFILWKDVPENTIYTTQKINRNFQQYFLNPNTKTINDLKDKLFDTLYGEKQNIFLHFLSRAIAGHHEDKRWATYLGNRNCGKGVEYDLLVAGFESYVNTFELGNILYNRKTAGVENIDCSKKLYWLMDLEFVRLSVSQEVPDCNSGLVANSKYIKKITGGGDTIVARRNYDRKDTHFKLDTTFYIKGNNTLTCDNVDCDETRLEFNSVVQFKSLAEIQAMKAEGRDELEMKRYKEEDSQIKEKCATEEWANAVVYLLYSNYKETKVDISKDIVTEDNSLLNTLKEKFILTGKQDDVMEIKEVYSILDTFDKGKITLELNSQNIFKKQNTTGPLRKKWCFFGIKEREEEPKQPQQLQQ